MVSPRGRTAAVFGPRDKRDIIDVDQVQSIEFIRNSHRGNGKSRAHRAK